AHEEEEVEFSENLALRTVRRVLPATDRYHGASVLAKVDGRRVVTPMLIVMVAIGTTDLLFALDSIPAIFGLTKEPYLVFTANAFALMGLRQLFFLIGGLIDRLIYLSKGLALILAFIGVKLVLETLHHDGVSWAPEVPIAVSLGVIVGTLAVTAVASLVKTRMDRARAAADVTGAAARPPSRAGWRPAPWPSRRWRAWSRPGWPVPGRRRPPPGRPPGSPPRSIDRRPLVPWRAGHRRRPPVSRRPPWDGGRGSRSAADV